MASMESTDSRIVSLLNSAQTSLNTRERVANLRIVQELLIHKEPNLLDNFLSEFIAFQNDRSLEVRKCVVNFIEEACKKEPEILPKLVGNLELLMVSEEVSLQKRVIQAMTHLYRVTLEWLSMAKKITPEMRAVYNEMAKLKAVIEGLLEEAHNDGIRTLTVKFLESIVLLQSSKSIHEQSSMGNTRGSKSTKQEDFSLDNIPLSLSVVKWRQLKMEGREAFEQLIRFHAQRNISSSNLMTTTQALVNIARQRQQYANEVLTALEMLHANLPQLSKSQVSSVRKQLKLQLLSLLKSCNINNNSYKDEAFFANMTQLLTDLGASKDEVLKALPNFEELKSKARRSSNERRGGHIKPSKSSMSISVTDTEYGGVDNDGSSKRRLGDDDDDDDDDDDEDDDDDDDHLTRNAKNDQDERKTAKTLHDSAVDETQMFIQNRLNPSMATELCMQAMYSLPTRMPPQFVNTFTPIAAAGTEAQVKHVSRLLATQFTLAKIGPGIEAALKKESSKSTFEKSPDNDDEDPDYKVPAKKRKTEETAGGKIFTVIGGSVTNVDALKEEEVETSNSTLGLVQPLQPRVLKSSRVKSLKLSEMTKKLRYGEKERLQVSTFNRLLLQNKSLKDRNTDMKRTKAITFTATHAIRCGSSSQIKTQLLSHILSDIKKHFDLALSWLYEEYCFYQSFNRSASISFKNDIEDESVYNDIMTRLIGCIIECDIETSVRLDLLTRVFLEAPLIAETAIEKLREFIQIEDKGMQVMKKLVQWRPTKKLNVLHFLLEFCSHNSQAVRSTANEIVLGLYSQNEFTDIIEKYSVWFMKLILEPKPPEVLFGENRGRGGRPVNKWTEELSRVCLELFLSLLGQNLNLFHHVADIYASQSINNDMKRVILRSLEKPMEKISVHNTDHLDVIIKIIKECPEGSETLITRMVHILTDNTALPREKQQRIPVQLVLAVKTVYESRVHDIRFLIPVISGLNKQEVTKELPKLTTLNPQLMKDVLTKLLVINNGPLTPSELLIALHNIDSSRVNTDVKGVIRAINQCLLQQKDVFNQEVLAIVLQQLQEQNEIPILYMRTVIQAVNVYPGLVSFVMNLLQRLIIKQVWKDGKLWNGFIKCCERTVPQSYTVLLQLPPAQLRLVFGQAPQLQEPLLQHVEAFSMEHRAHVSKSIMEVLYDADVEKKKHHNKESTHEDESVRMGEGEKLSVVEDNKEKN